MTSALKEKLDSLYDTYNQREYVDPDPLLFLYDYPEKRDREIVGFIAACFAYGRVEMIMKTVRSILEKLKPTPFTYLMHCRKKDLERDYKGFRYRFASDTHLVNLLWGMKQVIIKYKSLENCFYSGWTKYERSERPERLERPGETVLPGLVLLTQQIRGNKEIGHLLADPEKKSACKRSHLFLRWMVREDRVDPGGWDKISPSRLIVPLDTHMYRTGCLFAFTHRKSLDMKTALEITRGFQKIIKEDPVKYDFCLTRFGIRRELDTNQLKNAVGC